MAPIPSLSLREAWTDGRLWIIILSVWTFAPLFRRMYDLKTGTFNSISPFSLLPLVVLFPAAWAAYRRWHDVEPAMRIAILWWFGVFGYGLVIGCVMGNGLAPFYTFATFALPAACGAWFSLWKAQPEAKLAFLADSLLICLSISSVYGIFQYVSPPPWDGMWLYATGLFAAGVPVPFGLRPWATLNLPGLYAEMLAMTLVINVFVKRPMPILRSAAMLLCFAMLLVTLVRAAWIAFAIALVIGAILSPRRGTLMSTLLACAIVLGVGSAAGAVFGLDLGPSVQHVTDRFSSFDSLDTDTSANVRQAEADAAVSDAPNFPLGKGLGVIGTGAKLNPNFDKTVDNDGGYFERLIEMGYPGVGAYVLVIAGILIATFRRWNRARREKDLSVMNAIAISLTIQLFLIWMDSATDNHVDMYGLMFWMFVSLGFAPVIATKKRRRSLRGTADALSTPTVITAGSVPG